MYAIVSVLVLYQLTISGFASDDIRTVSERHLLLLGDLLLLLPLLLMPLGSRLLVWRTVQPSATANAARSESSISSNDWGTGS